MNKEDLIYLAGLIDGEGWIGIKINSLREEKNSFVARLSVTTTSPKIEKFLRDIIEGYSYYEPKPEGNRKPRWHWYLGRVTKLENLLKNLLPYLKCKKKQAQIVLEFLSIRKNRGDPRKEILYKQVKRLNQ